MSVKNNSYVAFALAALGVTLTAGAKPVAEGLLNDYKVLALDVAQVDDRGRCIVFATVQKASETPEVRTVCASSGDVRLFTDLSSVDSLVKKSKFQGDTVVTYKRKEKTASVGDPIVSLKALYKSFKSEKLVAVKALTVITNKKAAGIALGWDTAVGTPEAEEFADYLAKEASVSEWQDYCAARVTALEAALTAAGVDPASVV
jgi:hypothetical protein